MSTTSINFLMRHARFTVTLNGGTLMDSFFTQARSLWHRTDGVIFSENITEGLAHMLEPSVSPWPEQRKLRQRQLACWYRRMALDVAKTAAENVQVLQMHLDALDGLPNRML